MPSPSREKQLEASIIRLRKALSYYAHPEEGWDEIEHADACEESRDLVPDDEEERAENERFWRDAV